MDKPTAAEAADALRRLDGVKANLGERSDDGLGNDLCRHDRAIMQGHIDTARSVLLAAIKSGLLEVE